VRICIVRRSQIGYVGYGIVGNAVHVLCGVAVMVKYGNVPNVQCGQPGRRWWLWDGVGVSWDRPK
jgi:hypothetical protein